jgi:hypothetical protein
MAAVFAQMHGDAVRARADANQRGFDRVRLAATRPPVTGFPEGSHVIDIDSEFQGKGVYLRSSRRAIPITSGQRFRNVAYISGKRRDLLF